MLDSDPDLPKKLFLFTSMKPFKNDEKYFFLSHVKSFSILEMFSFFPWLFGNVEKRLNEKAKFTFRIYDVKASATNNYCLIAQEVKATRQ